MAELLVTADPHFNHGNIIRYCNRPFRDLNHMNNEIIRRWNERVKKEDTVINIGDWCFKNSPGGKIGEGGQETAQYWADRLNGNKVFIRGNHDKNNSLVTRIESLVLDYAKTRIFVTHRPKHYRKDFKINLVGHIHQAWKYKKSGDVVFYDKDKSFVVEGDTILINVGVDVWNFYPVKMDEIFRFISKIKREEK